MARRGNRASYADKLDLDAARRQMIADGLGVWQTDKAQALKDAIESFATTINCADLLAALDYLATCTGDPAFKTAALALRAYALTTGGLKASVKGLAAHCGALPESQAIPLMRQFVEDGHSEREAASLAAVFCALEGASHEAVTDDLRKAFAAAKRANFAPPETPSGDTGRRLRVMLLVEVVRDGEISRRILFPPIIEEDGVFCIVADDRHWRRLIEEGHAVLHGVIAGSEIQKK